MTGEGLRMTGFSWFPGARQPTGMSDCFKIRTLPQQEETGRNLATHFIRLYNWRKVPKNKEGK